MSRKLLYYVKSDVNFEAEGRRFYFNEKYPVYEKDANYVILCADNGDFCFSKELMEQAIKEWELEVSNR